MFVSLLQLMGWPAAMPSAAAGEGKPRQQAESQGKPGIKPGPNDLGRRPTVTSAVKKKNAPAKGAAKPKPAKATKPVAKPAAKAAGKGKGAVKAAAAKKPLAKPATKAKPAAKPAAKPVAKGKPAAKLAKPAKPVKSAKAAKPPSKKASLPAKTSSKTAAKPVKSAAKPANKPAVKPAAKTAKAPAKAPVKAAKVAAKAPASKASANAPAKAPVAAPAKAGKAVPAAKGPATPSAVPAVDASGIQRSAKPSSRLAQITVPSMAQAVASNAAKASYLPSMTPVSVAPVAPAAIKRDPKLANNWKTKTPEQLSDAEVLAMPEAEYMNDKQMAFFRLRLQQLKRDILANAGETTEHLREDTVIVPDPADRATIEEEHALELRTRDRERKLLKKIEQSIARIDAGDYGYCDETGEPIGVARLLARPTATLSLEAQQRRELKQKMFGN
jgi:DnaK suppressor protein